MKNRDELVALISEVTSRQPTAYWIEALEKHSVLTVHWNRPGR